MIRSTILSNFDFPSYDNKYFVVDLHNVKMLNIHIHLQIHDVLQASLANKKIFCCFAKLKYVLCIIQSHP